MFTHLEISMPMNAEEKIIQFDECSVLDMIDQFTTELTDLIESAESTVQNIFKVGNTLNKVIDSKDIQEIMVGINEWHEKIQSEEASYTRGLYLFSEGKVNAAASFLRKTKKRYFKLLSQSDFEFMEPLALLNDIHEFKAIFEQITFNFNKKIDYLFKELEGTYSKIIAETETLADIQGDEFKEIIESIQLWLGKLFPQFLKNLETRAFKATAFCIDMAGRQQGCIPNTEPKIQEDIFQLYANNKELSFVIQELSKISNIVPLFNDFYSYFNSYIREVLLIDAIAPPSTIRRVAYFRQGIDKAIIFNPGFCRSGTREWAEKFDNERGLKQATPDRRQISFTSYEQFHHFSVSEKTYHLQKNQKSVTQLNDSGNHLYVQMSPVKSEFPIKIGETTINGNALQAFIQRLMDDLNRMIMVYLAIDDKTPTFDVVLLKENEKIGHSIGFKVFKLPLDKILVCFRDLNYGEFESDSIETMRTWFYNFFIKTPYPLMFDTYKISSLHLKVKHSKTLQNHFYDNIPRMRFPNKTWMQWGYYEQMDKTCRQHMGENLNAIALNPAEALNYREKIIRAYSKLSYKKTFDHQLAVFTYMMIVSDLEDIDPKKAFEMANLAHQIILQQVGDENKNEWLFLIAMVKIMVGMISHSLNGQFQKNDIMCFKKAMLLFEKLIETHKIEEDNKRKIIHQKISEFRPLLESKNYDTIYKNMNEFCDLVFTIGELYPIDFMIHVEKLKSEIVDACGPEKIESHLEEKYKEEKKEVKCFSLK